MSIEAAGDQGPVCRIKEVWGYLCSDLNYRKHPGGAVNRPEDFPQLTPEKMVAWYKSIHDDRFAWCWIKWQSGHAAFPSKVLPHMENLSADFFQRHCELSKAEGMYVCGYTCGGDDVYAFEQHPEWFQEYGRRFACLNAPFWDREFEAIQEALNLFPCDGLFYDMVRFTGKCRCTFCRAAYKQFYGEQMPEKHDTNRFRFDTFKRWVERATKAAREIVPSIEICANHQWFRLDGVPYELLEHFDWYYCEFGPYEWVGEILRAWGDRPLFVGNAIQPRYVAHLLGRRAHPLAYDTFTDYRTGEFVSPEDRRLKPIKQVLAEVGKQEPYLKDAVPVPHVAVLFTSAYDLSKRPTDARFPHWLLGEERYAEAVAAWVRDAVRMNLSCCSVEIAERLTAETLNRYEAVFVPELAWVGEKIAVLLQGWVDRGGVLFVSGPFGLLNEDGKPLRDFAGNGLLGVTRVEGPLDTFAVLTTFRSNGAFKQMEELVPLDNAIICKASGAEAAAYGNVGADEGVPLMWRHEVGNGLVFFLAGRLGERLVEDVERRERLMRNCLRALLSSCIKRAPFTTSIEYPAEVWLNAQPAQRQLILHVVAYDRPLLNETLSLRADLVSDNDMEIVYPPESRAIISGKRDRDYVHFALPEVYRHVVLATKGER